jgi:hypothetical protein
MTDTIKPPMNVHITMQSGGHFKVEGDQAREFMRKFQNATSEWIEFPCQTWTMMLKRENIEALSIKE